MNDATFKVTNPLGIVAIFAGISEVATSVALIQLPTALQEKFIWFVMFFPVVLTVLFFYVLYRKPAVFFSPGDYKKEELYVSSIGLSQNDPNIDSRIRILEETLTALQDFIEKSKLQADGDVDFSDIRKNIELQKSLETNPLYRFITYDLQIDHSEAQGAIHETKAIENLATVIERRTESKKKAARVTDLIAAFPNVTNDFLKLKNLLSGAGS